MNINSENIGELAGNQSILDKKKENTSKVSFLKENIKGGISYFLILNPEKPDVPLNKNDAFQKVQKRRVQEKR